MHRVVVTGLGAITPLGVGIRRSWSRILAGHCGIVSLNSDPAFAQIPSKVAGLVPRGRREDGGWTPGEWLERGNERQMALFTQFAVAAAQEAVEDANLVEALSQSNNMPNGSTIAQDAGVCLGSGIGAFDDVYNTSVAYANGGHHKVSPLFVPRLLINLAAGHIAMKYKLQGPNLSPTTACTTGLHAVIEAAHLIRAGHTRLMLAGASESCIHPLALSGFARARSLSTGSNDAPAAASRPFDLQRDGFVIGEGAGVLVLEDLESALARDAPIYAEVTGTGMSCDAWHMTAPREDGHGAVLAMQRAVRDAGRARHATSPWHIGYVNAHATSTALGDSAENTAIHRVLCRSWEDGEAFGLQTLAPSDVNVSSTKGATGHLLGAAGAVEAIFSILALRDGILPPTLNLDQPGDLQGSGMAASGSDEHEYSDKDASWDMNYVPHVAQECKHLRAVMTNSFGFGGTNASVIFTKYEDP